MPIAFYLAGTIVLAVSWLSWVCLSSELCLSEEFPNQCNIISKTKMKADLSPSRDTRRLCRTMKITQAILTRLDFHVACSLSEADGKLQVYPGKLLRYVYIV